MVISLSHQIGALSGTPIPVDSRNRTNNGELTASVSAAAVWKSPPVTPCRSPSRYRSPSRVFRYRSPSPVFRYRSPSPVMMGIRPDLSAVCQAFATEMEAMTEKEEAEQWSGDESESGVAVFVMMPLDSVTMGHSVNRKKAMDASLKALKSAGVEGIMMDVWWGLVEGDSPGEYNWGGYTDLLEMAEFHDLKVQAVMSFHQCGGNVGDSVTIPLPKWAVQEIKNNPDLAYTDQWGRRNHEYISLAADTVSLLKGRTPVQCYSDFMRAFRDNFTHLLGDTIVEIQVGMGPAGELRYPSYPEAEGTWKFPGIGAFQCYDKYMLNSLKATAEAAGKPEWGHTGPTDAGHYNNWPEDTLFFRKHGGWDTEYGKFFLNWYSKMLLDHGDRILSSASSIFNTTGLKISAKVAGIHWHYGTRSHAPELTAGYYNTRFNDGYLPIAKMLAKNGAVFNFTCIEMRDHEQPDEAQCAPEKLVKQVATATEMFKVPLAGENALPRFDEFAHEQIFNSASLEGDRKMCAFTYLRMCPELFQPDNWRKFVGFVTKMKEGKEMERCKEDVERDTGRFVNVPRPSVQREKMGDAVMAH